ncbi:hypothetical protein HJ202_24800 [Vibrio parahaemolyticus]|uniref:Uncharacterized protein n=1 Tax=Vibrio parahaemolyticus TaxID=670 RepID=A0AA47L9M1_VIBPH|nr:hypothetical protein [Vibrio parahaemolyticus]EGQ9299079.1 hypothetical protein [Vibrio parahaemolyticus]EGR0686867.1 hypothetical protein [Vibrio parahaemolyticus]EJG0326616.1 hypothetical protein [Vibrio parahaemolyticus]MBE3723502.1 hypothetical protein [Vibrio parahaemolyticus]OUJ51064.1 hypothetical protein BTM22_12380 [Vibrio parahaemolyticus]
MKISSFDKKVVISLFNQLTPEKTETSTERNGEIDKVALAVRLGKIRFIKQEDQYVDLKALSGDLFDPDVNIDISKEELKRSESAFRVRVHREGVWIVESQYWTGRAWEGIEGISNNVICGFVGDDFVGSGYELDLGREALAAYNSQPLDALGFVIDPFRQE